MRYRIWWVGILAILLSLLGSAGLAGAQEPQVRVVFFTSPVCNFCTLVEERDLPPLEERYGEQLWILRVDTTRAQGREMFERAWELYDIPPERRGVPMMIVDDQVLVGAAEIPAQLPGLVARYLEAGGLDWPVIPGLEAAIEAAEREASGIPLWQERFQRDLPGNYVSVGLLVGMLVLAGVLFRSHPWQQTLSRQIPGWLKVGTALLGLGVALYLTYGETAAEELFCGPIGQCNVVQQSELAVLFGFLPMALFGALGYLAILASYAYEQWGKGPYVELTPVLSLGLTTFGFGFSIFLTFWQPFGIGATCMWCLASAVTMSLSFLFSVGSGRAELEKIRKHGGRSYLRYLKSRAGRERAVKGVQGAR